MNPRRFDSLTRHFAARMTRRDTIRAGFGASLGAVLLDTAPSAAQDTKTTTADRFLSIASYPWDGDIETAKTELKPLLRLMQQQPGFITLAFIEGSEALYLVTTFLDESTSAAGMHVLEEWIVSTEQETLTDPSEQARGASFLRSSLGAGCPCHTDDDDPCGDDDLVCCPTGSGDRGFCMTAITICPAFDEETGDDQAAPTPLVSVPSDGTPVCTHAGCTCVGGQPDSCDDGLSCCGANASGDAGVCMTTCPCGSEGCTCIAAEVSTCDDGLICCAPGEIGGVGTCQYACTCSGEGCACTTGLDGTCDTGLVCCGIGSQAPGSIGVCLTFCDTSAPCPGAEGCECGPIWKCNDGLICCGAVHDDDPGICGSDC